MILLFCGVVVDNHVVDLNTITITIVASSDPYAQGCSTMTHMNFGVDNTTDLSYIYFSLQQ